MLSKGPRSCALPSCSPASVLTQSVLGVGQPEEIIQTQAQAGQARRKCSQVDRAVPAEGEIPLCHPPPPPPGSPHPQLSRLRPSKRHKRTEPLQLPFPPPAFLLHAPGRTHGQALGGQALGVAAAAPGPSATPDPQIDLSTGDASSCQHAQLPADCSRDRVQVL